MFYLRKRSQLCGGSFVLTRTRIRWRHYPRVRSLHGKGGRRPNPSEPEAPVDQLLPLSHLIQKRNSSADHSLSSAKGPRRRTVPAVVVGFAGYFAARILVDTWLRGRFVTPLTATWRAVAPGTAGPSRVEEPASLHNAWVISERPSDKLGHPVSLQIGDCSRVAAGHVKR